MQAALSLRLVTEISHGSKFLGPLTGMSPLEIELLLNDILSGNIQSGSPQDNIKKREVGAVPFGYDPNIFNRKYGITEEQLLATPQVLVTTSDSGFLAVYNPDIQLRLNSKVEELRQYKKDDKSIDKLLYAISRQRVWIEQRQVEIVKYLCEKQVEYLTSENALKLKELTQEELARHFGYDNSTISRLVKNLTFQLDGDKKYFARQLIPGAQITGQKIRSALAQLSKDPKYFQNGRWRVSYYKLLKPVIEIIGFDITRRGLSKYVPEFGGHYGNHHPKRRAD